MNATINFYDDSTDVVLTVPRADGGKNNIIFEAVSSCLNYAKEMGYTIVRALTHQENGEITITQ